MSRGLKVGDVYQDQEGEAKRAAIIISVDADGARARLEFLDGNGDFPATQDQLVSWTIIGSLAFQGDPAPWRVVKTGEDGKLRWQTYAPDEAGARLISAQAEADSTGRVVISAS